LSSRRSVLIVDRSEETRDVLRTALERRGLRVLAASRARRGLELLRRHHPDLIVLDLDLVGESSEQTCARFAGVASEQESDLVVLGSRRPPIAGQEGEFVRKPYHYGPLIRRIEQLLGVAGQALARCA
jgi:two-component system cell cycle response regulator